jgi:hypothetical protein
LSILCPKCLQEGRKTSRGGLIKLAKGFYCVVCGYRQDHHEDKKKGLKLRARNAAITRKDFEKLRGDEMFA